LIQLLKYKIQTDKDLKFTTDENWTNDQFLTAIAQTEPIREFKLEPGFALKLDKFLNYVSNWLTQAAFVRSNLNTDEIDLITQKINIENFFSGYYDATNINLFYLPIYELKEDFFSKFKNLKALDLTDTKIKTIPAGLFRSLIYLIKLKIGKNTKRIQDHSDKLKLPDFLFEFCGNFMRLYINFNVKNIFIFLNFKVSLTSLEISSVESINHKSFTGLTKIESLTLDSVFNIENDGPFRYLRNLKILNIKDTLIDLNVKFFQTIILSLNSFSLTNNPINYCEKITSVLAIEPSTFSKLSNLTILTIEYNYIPIIKQEMFSGLTRLKHLMLKANRIEEIEFYSFCDLYALETLDLSYRTRFF